MGAINDYAAALGPKSRQELKALIELLRAEGVNVTLLITLLDPYSNPELLSQSIWEEWGLEAEATVLLLFVREEDRWRFHWRASPDLTSSLSSQSASSQKSAIEALLAQRRVAQAARRAVKFLSGLLTRAPVGERSEAAAPQQEAHSWVKSRGLWYGLLGGLGGVGLVIALLRLAVIWLCPNCGSRLKRESGRSLGFAYGGWSQSRRGHKNRVYYCRRCGYLRWGER